MRLRILEDTFTVGRFYKAGEVDEVQDPLALALIAQGKAEDPFVAKAPGPIPVIPVERPPIVETTTSTGTVGTARAEDPSTPKAQPPAAPAKQEPERPSAKSKPIAVKRPGTK